MEILEKLGADLRIGSGEIAAILKKHGAVTRDIKKLYRRNRTVLHKLCFKFYEGGKNYVQNFRDRARL